MSDASKVSRLAHQLQFILEIDKLKGILRRTMISGGGRLENSAEHSWQLAIMALVLAEHANEAVDVAHVVMLVLVHDIVEIDAGDTFAYDETGYLDKAEREILAAERLFGLLPTDQQATFYGLWQEFEGRETAEAKFAHAIDRLMPLLLNQHNGGMDWHGHGLASGQVIGRNQVIADGSAALWEVAREIIDNAIVQGLLAE